MVENVIDRIGNWNPQLLRELKGRLKPRNVALASGISLFGQLLLFMCYQTQLPVALPSNETVYNRYCLGEQKDYYLPTCIKNISGFLDINWNLWWQDLFVTISLINLFFLLVAGTYLLISDLAQEERRGTLNFIRLSPQSTQSILVGKILGVPVWIYLVSFLSIPFHLWSGLSAQIPLGLIFTFYAFLVGSCIFFYSGALLLGLFGTAFNGLQPWLGGGLVLTFLQLALYKPILNFPLDWFSLFSPASILPYLVKETVRNYNSVSFTSLQMDKLQWFFLPIGDSATTVTLAALANFAICSFFIWQTLLRRFPNPSKTILSKGQSYCLVACFELTLLGFTVQQSEAWGRSDSNNALYNFNFLLVFNLILFLGLIAALSPQRQTLLDWARYRRERVANRNLLNVGLIKDLIWGENSPALITIAINLIIAGVILAAWIPFWNNSSKQLDALASLLITMSIILVYAAIAQYSLFVQKRKQILFVPTAALVILAAIAVPPLVLLVLSLTPDKQAGLWLFTAFPWIGIEHASVMTVFLSFLAQVSLIGLFNLQFTRQLKKAGESASKALLSSRSSLPVS